MEDRLFPTEVSDWTWDTLQFLSENQIEESTYLEYKEYLTYPNHRDIEPSRSEWRHDVEREFTAFANGSGGIIVFGMSDRIEISPCPPSEHEVARTVNQFIKDTTPIVDIEMSDKLAPRGDTDRFALAVKISEATRKPVKTSGSSYYVRVNDQKQPMSREQLESMFVEEDRRQQAVRQLELEISRFKEAYEENIEILPLLENPPPLESVDEEALRDVFLRNTHLFSDEEVEYISVAVLSTLDDISAKKRFYLEGCNNLDRVWCQDYKTLNKTAQKGLKSDSQDLLSLFERLVANTQINFRKSSPH